MAGYNTLLTLATRTKLHSMTSVLLNGGTDCVHVKRLFQVALDDVSVTEWRYKNYSAKQWGTYAVALDDVSVTEWRAKEMSPSKFNPPVALDDVSVTEWRVAHSFTADEARRRLHSMTSMLFVPRKLNATGQQNKGKGLIPTPKADEAGTSLSAVRRLLFGLWSTGQSCSQGECI